MLFVDVMIFFLVTSLCNCIDFFFYDVTYVNKKKAEMTAVGDIGNCLSFENLNLQLTKIL